jgi:hypothetical protein
MSTILTIAGKTVTELVGSGDITYDRQSPQAMRRLLADWADAPTICEALCGTVARIGITSLVYTPPTRHPSPKYNFLFALRARVSGLGPPSQDGLGIISYPKAIIEVEYQPLPDQNDNSSEPQMTFVTERREMGAEFMTLPKSTLVWASADTLTATKSTVSIGEESRAGMLIPLTHVNVDIPWWFAADSRINGLVFDNAIGKVNKNDFRFLYTKWPAETLLFNGASFNRQWTSQGAQAWQVSLNFTYKRTRWNRLYDTRAVVAAGTDGFFTFCKTNSDRVYQPIDFKLLMPDGYNARPPLTITGPIGVRFPGVTA